MTNEMIKRVARAIYAEADKQDYVSDYGFHRGRTSLDGNFDLSLLARAAIQALREPNEAMIDAGYCEPPTDINELIEYWNTLSPEDIWPAMIDAILKEHP